MDTIKLIISQIKGKTAKNGMWLYLLQIFNTVIPLVTLPYFARVLSTETNGSIVIALNAYGYLQVLVEYGFALSATRKVALAPDDIKRTSNLFTRVFFSRIILASIGMAIALGYWGIYHDHPEQSICLLIMSACSYGYCLQLNWFFQGIQDMKYISITNIIGRSTLVLLTFLLVKSREDIYIYAVLTAILPFFSGIIGLIIARKKYELRFVKISFQEVIDELKDGFLVFTTSLSSKVFGAIGVTLLGIFCEKSEVGIYGYIQRIPNVMVMAWAPIAQVLYPISSQRMQKSFADGKRFVYSVRKIIIIVFALAALLISVFSNPLIKFAFGEEYAARSYWVIPLLAWVVVSINNNFLGHQILLSSGHDKEYSKCFQINVAITMVLNLAFILLWDCTGASFAPLVSELCLTVMEIYQIKKIEQKLYQE